MAALASPADLEARLGRALTAEETTRAVALLADASALIRGYTRQQFDLVVDDEVLLRPVGASLRLPQRPVVAVASVVAVGAAPLPDVTLPVGAWRWDGLDLVELAVDDPVWLSLPEAWWEGEGPDTYRVTYTHGYATVPEDVVAVCCAMVLRVLTAPTTSDGLAGETIGGYAWRADAGGVSGTSVRLTQADRDALARYRRQAGTIALRVR